jgi:pyrroline-5-carboxylate reductase
MIANGFVSGPQDISAYDPWPEQLQRLKTELQINVCSNNLDVVSNSDIIILAVKPHMIQNVLSEVKSLLKPTHVLVSIAAGVTLATLAAAADADTTKVHVVRVMPNTPCMVGCSASAFALGANATNEDMEVIKSLFESVGIAYSVEERLLDAVTGLSGSGPAYVYMFIEALSDGGVAAGLPRNVATQLAAQTVQGAAKMVLETGKHPGQLKDAVTSPGGTTIEGVATLEANGLRSACISAVRAAASKSASLGAANK